MAPEVCTNERALKGLYHAFDKRGQSWDKRGVRFKELAAMVVVLSPAMPLEERLSLMFTLFDEDGNGLIDPIELHAVLATVLALVRPNSTEPEIEAEIEAICKPNSNRNPNPNPDWRPSAKSTPRKPRRPMPPTMP